MITSSFNSLTGNFFPSPSTLRGESAQTLLIDNMLYSNKQQIAEQPKDTMMPPQKAS